MKKGTRIAKIQKDQFVQQPDQSDLKKNNEVNEIQFSLNQINSLIDGKIVSLKKCQGYSVDQINHSQFFENLIASNKIIESQLNEVLEICSLNMLPNSQSKKKNQGQTQTIEIVNTFQPAITPIQNPVVSDLLPIIKQEDKTSGVRFDANIIKTYQIDKVENQENHDNQLNNIQAQKYPNNSNNSNVNNISNININNINNQENNYVNDDYMDEENGYYDQYGYQMLGQNDYFDDQEGEEVNLVEEDDDEYPQNNYQENQYNNRGYSRQNQLPIYQNAAYLDNSYPPQNSIPPFQQQKSQQLPYYNRNPTTQQAMYDVQQPIYNAQYQRNCMNPINNGVQNARQRMPQPYYPEEIDDEEGEEEGVVMGQQNQKEFNNGYMQSYLYQKKRQPGQPMRNILEQQKQLSEYNKFQEKYGIEIPQFFKNDSYLQKTPRSRFFSKLSQKEFFAVAQIYEVLQTQQKVAELLDTSVPNVKRILSYVQQQLMSGQLQPQNNFPILQKSIN